jgi:hypothetical protein
MKQKILAQSTPFQNMSDSLDTVTVIVEATSMMRKVPMGTDFILEHIWYHGYIATRSISCQAVWMRRMLKDLLLEKQEATTILCNNNSIIILSKNHMVHKKTKHIDTRYHFIRESVNNKEICL